MSSKGGKKIRRPHEQASPIPKYVPRAKVFEPSAGSDGELRIRFNHVDIGGPWCISTISADHLYDLMERLKALESMACNQVFAPGSQLGKIYQVADLPDKTARERLVELEYDDQTEIARLHISAQRRLYGFLPDGGPEFYALWWDPQHTIWPSTLKNT